MQQLNPLDLDLMSQVKTLCVYKGFAFETHLWSLRFVVHNKSRARLHQNFETWLEVETSIHRLEYLYSLGNVSCDICDV